MPGQEAWSSGPKSGGRPPAFSSLGVPLTKDLGWGLPHRVWEVWRYPAPSPLLPITTLHQICFSPSRSPCPHPGSLGALSPPPDLITTHVHTQASCAPVRESMGLWCPAGPPAWQVWGCLRGRNSRAVGAPGGGGWSCPPTQPRQPPGFSKGSRSLSTGLEVWGAATPRHAPVSSPCAGRAQGEVSGLCGACS